MKSHVLVITLILFRSNSATITGHVSVTGVTHFAFLTCAPGDNLDIDLDFSPSSSVLHCCRTCKECCQAVLYREGKCMGIYVPGGISRHWYPRQTHPRHIHQIILSWATMVPTGCDNGTHWVRQWYPSYILDWI